MLQLLVRKFYYIVVIICSERLTKLMETGQWCKIVKFVVDAINSVKAELNQHIRDN